jgi:polyhydroxybutyrate depolymerase
VAAFIPTTCPAARAGPSVVAIHGTADPVVPYQGGQVAGGGTGIPAALDTFTQYGEDYGCAEPVVEPGPVAGVERRRLRECTGGRDVVLYTVADGGHEWPGATGTGLAAAGEQLFATDTILDFFDHHVKPTP